MGNGEEGEGGGGGGDAAQAPGQPLIGEPEVVPSFKFVSDV